MIGGVWRTGYTPLSGKISEATEFVP
jgi:hypothetical protein